MKDKTNIFIEKAKAKHGDRYDYSNTTYINCKTKVIIICKKHGEFEQTPNNHLQGKNCRKCSGNYMDTEYFIEKATIVHKFKYNYSKVMYIKSTRKVIIICNIHGEFEQTPGNHLSGKGCIKCAGNYLDKEYFIEKAIIKHGNKYDYSKVVYKKNNIKVIIICKIHGEFKQTPASHLCGKGCSKCTGHYMDRAYFIQKANTIHRNNYDYSKIVYKNNRTNVIIICKIHGEFEQSPDKHLQGHRCIKCAGRYLDRDYFIEIAENIHNKKYDYSKVVYNGNKTKVTIICPIHDEFKQVPNSHLSGSGCPKCQLCPKCMLWRTHGRLCVYCKPKKSNNLYRKTKEWKVVKYLRNKIPDYDFIHNKSVGKECTYGHLLPDIRFNLGFYQLIVEVDEHKHRGANYKCDKQRMYDIIAK